MADAGESQQPFLVCASYTHARRHPMVLGKIGGWSPPIQLSIAQVLALVSGYVLVVWGWDLWAHGPAPLNLAIAAAGPWLPAWALRAVRIEGRDVLRTGIGALAYAAKPRRGTCLGRPCPDESSTRLSARLFVRGSE